MTYIKPVPAISADDEWSLLKTVLVGRAENSCFPHEPPHMLEATMPKEHHHHFKPFNPFPPSIVQGATQELDNFARILQNEGITVHRPHEVNWLLTNRGYTGAMPRDGLLVVGNTIIESCFAWHSRTDEVSLALGNLLSAFQSNPAVRVVRAPQLPVPDTLYDTTIDKSNPWAINNNRPAFDAADFMRFGSTVIGQLSNVTNMKGVQHVEDHLPPGYKIELLEVDDPHAMHIDATLLPLRQGLLVYNPLRVTAESLRRHAVFKSWELTPFPFVESVERAERRPGDIPRYMTSAWLVLNILVLGDNKVVVEESHVQFAGWLEQKGMRVIRAPFRNVHAIGGSFHCATVDLVRMKSG